jgi:hypothetical protein
MVLNQDFKEFLSALNDNSVRYLVVGGYAVALHGHPRYTKDIDVWIDRTDANAERMVQALEDFGFGALGLRKADFLVEDQIIQLGYAPNRIDIITDLPGVEFTSSYEARVVVDVGDILVNFIDLDNLKQNKRTSGRYQDLADLENLE